METEHVVLVDSNRTVVGSAPKDAVHTTDTPLHLAFSCYLLDERGRLLLTRRALQKLTWPGVWTNSFCGHPAPGEEVEDAVRRHGLQELGLGPGAIEDIRVVLPDFRYRAVDSNGLVENEICPVFVARLAAGAVLTPNPAEVDDCAWAEPGDVVAALDAAPFAFSPWFVEELADPRLRQALSAPWAGDRAGL